jgi:putative transposase
MTQDLTAQALWRAVRSKRPAPSLIHHSTVGRNTALTIT